MMKIYWQLKMLSYVNKLRGDYMAINDVSTCDCDVIHEEIVEEVKKEMIEEDILIDVADFFKVLGDSTRSKIMFALDKREMCVCDLSSLLNMTKSAISHQLKVLRDAKLVSFRREGKMVYYFLADNHVREVFEKAVEHVTEK